MEGWWLELLWRDGGLSCYGGMVVCLLLHNCVFDNCSPYSSDHHIHDMAHFSNQEHNINNLELNSVY